MPTVCQAWPIVYSADRRSQSLAATQTLPAEQAGKSNQHHSTLQQCKPHRGLHPGPNKRVKHEAVQNNLSLTPWVPSGTSSAFHRPRHRIGARSDRDSTTSCGVREGRTYDRYHRQILTQGRQLASLCAGLPSLSKHLAMV